MLLSPIFIVRQYNIIWTFGIFDLAWDSVDIIGYLIQDIKELKEKKNEKKETDNKKEETGELEYKNLDELKAHYERGGLGDMKVKKFLNYVVQETLEPIRARRHELEKNIPEIYKIIFDGSDKARKEVAKTLEKVKKAIGIDYHNDEELLKSQIEKYKETNE